MIDDALSNRSASLPEPQRERWQPLRSGVLNLYRYDYEEFHFEDGRLLLRGNNGSGKSRVLALQLPFLLDGEVNPARVEPDGDPAKRIEWNLLMGKYPDRTGYTWIEFGRLDADGTAYFVTLGCGLRAVAGHSGLHSRWFFTTSLRVGRDLFLQTSLQQPVGRDRLQDLLGPAGRVFTKAEEYRRAVDETLFGLGPRYGALLELLLRLRRPQLSRKLDEEELSGALSDALPTLSSALIDEVAESFRSLQADREALREFSQARDSVGGFLREYAVYLRIGVRRRATAVRTSHSGYEAAQRDAREAEARLEAATIQLAELVSQRAIFDVQLAGGEAAERTLRESPEMRTAEELERAGEIAQTASGARLTAERDENHAAIAASRAATREREAHRATESIETELTAKLLEADARAIAADFVEIHREHIPAPPLLAASGAPWAASAESALSHSLAQRQRACQLLRQRNHSVSTAEQAFTAAEAARRRAEDAASLARESEHSAREALEVRGRELSGAYTAWRAVAIHLRVPAEELVAEAFGIWLERRDGLSPLRRGIETAHGGAISAFAGRASSFQRRISEFDLRIGELTTSIQRLESGETSPPPPPLTRRADRTKQPGAPFWRVCDFRPEVSPKEKAGIEAALQASGMLDAWVFPDGRVLAQTEGEDTFLWESEAAAILPASRLGQKLIGAIDPEDANARNLHASTIERLLSRIGFGEGAGEHWVSPDGKWQLGVLGGRWTKPTAEYIGESTRAAARRRQLEDLRVLKAEAVTARERAQEEGRALEREKNEALVEFACAPSDEPVVRAGYALETATRMVSQTFAASERASREASALREPWQEALRAREQDAAELKLARWIERIDELIQASLAYQNALAALWPTVRHWETTAAQLADLREQTTHSEEELRSRRTRREQAEAAAEAARQRFETLQATHGQEVSVVLEKLNATAREVRRLKSELISNQTQQIEKTAARTRAEGDRTHAEEQRTLRDGRRQEAIVNLQRLAEKRLLAEADPRLRSIEEGGWSISRGVEIARQIEPLLADTPDDDESWRRRQDTIHGHVQDLRDQLISHGHQPETHQLEDLVLVSCVFHGRPHTMTELRGAFEAELDERQRLLEAKEREIIENHLLAEVAVEIQKLIRAAETWRQSANTELNARPTSSGVRFRFQWEPDMETRFHEVRPILLRKGELWTPAERTALAAFLQERIRAEQASDESGSWRDHLGKALDYRRWHRFVVERQQDNQWRRLDKRTYGTGSGGEKALALTLPRFAAAAAHYRSAAKTAPRLVMLDEAFAGIDPTMRAQCMGVLTQFDLDVVMTSELEWGCYASVPALAIYHLTAMAGIDAVAATRWVWNGRERRQEDIALPPASAPAEMSGMEPPHDDEPIR